MYTRISPPQLEKKHNFERAARIGARTVPIGPTSAPSSLHGAQHRDVQPLKMLKNECRPAAQLFFSEVPKK